MIKTYVIYGEDRSCGNFPDPPDTPLLGYAEGEYDDVLKYAQSLKGWKTWGKGGKIFEIKVIKI